MTVRATRSPGDFFSEEWNYPEPGRAEQGNSDNSIPSSSSLQTCHPPPLASNTFREGEIKKNFLWNFLSKTSEYQESFLKKKICFRIISGFFFVAYWPDLVPYFLFIPSSRPAGKFHLIISLISTFFLKIKICTNMYNNLSMQMTSCSTLSNGLIMPTDVNSRVECRRFWL